MKFGNAPGELVNLFIGLCKALMSLGPKPFSPILPCSFPTWIHSTACRTLTPYLSLSQSPCPLTQTPPLGLSKFLFSPHVSAQALPSRGSHSRHPSHTQLSSEFQKHPELIAIATVFWNHLFSFPLC